MKRLSLWLIFAFFLLLMISVARADDFTINTTPGLSWNFQAMTDYVQRGLSQTNGKPAGSVGVTYQLQNGLFVSGDVINSKQTNNNFEGDLVVGWATKLSDHWNYQVSIALQAYPGASDAINQSSVEFQNILNYVQDWGKLVFAFGMQPQGQGHAGFGTYTSTGMDINLPYKFVFGVRVGYNTYANHAVKPNYWDWTAVVSRPLTDHINLAVQYTGSTNYVESGNGNRVVGVVTITF